MMAATAEALDTFYKLLAKYEYEKNNQLNF